MGSISGYNALITLFPDMNSGIYTGVNGPMYGNANTSLHQ